MSVVVLPSACRVLVVTLPSAPVIATPFPSALTTIDPPSGVAVVVLPSAAFVAVATASVVTVPSSFTRVLVELPSAPTVVTVKLSALTVVELPSVFEVVMLPSSPTTPRSATVLPSASVMSVVVLPSALRVLVVTLPSAPVTATRLPSALTAIDPPSGVVAVVLPSSAVIETLVLCVVTVPSSFTRVLVELPSAPAVVTVKLSALTVVELPSVFGVVMLPSSLLLTPSADTLGAPSVGSRVGTRSTVEVGGAVATASRGSTVGDCAGNAEGASDAALPSDGASVMLPSAPPAASIKPSSSA